MATAASAVSVPTDETTLYDAETDGIYASSFYIDVSSGGDDCLLNVPGLHASGDWFRLSAGKSITFRLGSRGLAKVLAKAPSSTATVNYCIQAKVL